MIFRETFGHFADLMTGRDFFYTIDSSRTDNFTDPFGNYLCQKLLEYSTDEQRNVICESVAQDLVNISLNMHGTRAVQKMIDFLSTRRQASVVSASFNTFDLRDGYRLISDTTPRSILSSSRSAFTLLCSSRISTATM